MITELPVFVMTFFAAFLTVFALNLTITDVFRRRQRILNKHLQQQRREEERREIHRRAELQRNALLAVTQSENLSELAQEAFDKNAQDESLRRQLITMIEQSGLRVTLNNLIAYSAMAALAAGALAFLLLPSLLWAVVAASCAGAVPLAYVEFVRRRRLNRLREQLPDAFDLMARVLRAGQTISQAMQSASQEFDAPLAYEFGYCYEQQNLGISPDVALRDLGRRTGLLEMKIFVLSLTIHRQVGGNLAELLEKLAHIVRERFRLRDKIKALTAEGRFQAVILLALPVVVWGGILLVNRGYALKLFEHPYLVIGTLIAMLIGAICIHKIVNFDF